MPRGNKENLVSLATLSTERQREIASMGGKAAQQKKRERKTFKEQMLLMLENDENLQNDIIMALFKRAKKIGEKTGSAGNRAFELIRETIGEAPVEEKKLTVDYEDLTPLGELLGNNNVQNSNN